MSAVERPDRRVLVIYVNGVMGLDNSGLGLKYVHGFLEKEMLQHPQLQQTGEPAGTMPCSIHGLTIRYDVDDNVDLLDSSSMDQEMWCTIARNINDKYDDYDGFVLIHGLDTMAYTACALSFMLKNLTKPIVLTGAQFPLVEVSSDALDNLLGAIVIAGHFVIPEVTIFMCSQLFRGNRCKMYSSKGYAAMRSENYAPLAKFGVDIQVQWELVRVASRASRMSVIDTFCPNVALVMLHPLMVKADLEKALAPPVQGAVILSFGAGNASKSDFHEVFHSVSARGVVLVNLSQCLSGGVFGSALDQVGLVDGVDMTIEAAFTKLAWLLPQYDAVTVRKMMRENIVGELTGDNAGHDALFDYENFINCVGHVMDAESDTARCRIEEVLHPVLLCCAAKAGSIVALRDLLRQSADVNCADYGQRTALHIAAAEGQIQAVEFLVNARANPNLLDRLGASPLVEAAQARKLNIVDYLVERSAHLSDHPFASRDLLTFVSLGDVEKAEIWMRAGADPNVADFDGKQPLMIAAATEQRKLVEVLLAARADPLARDVLNNSALDVAAGNSEILSMIQTAAGLGERTYCEQKNEKTVN